jgi:hypothetical protein
MLLEMNFSLPGGEEADFELPVGVKCFPFFARSGKVTKERKEKQHLSTLYLLIYRRD